LIGFARDGGFGVLCSGALALVFGAEARSDGVHLAGARLGSAVLATLPYLFLAYVVMGLGVAVGVIDPLNPFRALAYFSVSSTSPGTSSR